MGGGLAAGLLARVAPCTVWVELGNADVAQVAQGADAFRQALQQLGLLQQRDVSGRTWDTVRHIHNGAGYFIDRNLAFQGVLLLDAV